MKPTEFNVSELKTDESGAITRNGSRVFGLRLKSIYTFQNESLFTLISINAVIGN
jgi:hypothetical protein